MNHQEKFQPAWVTAKKSQFILKALENQNLGCYLSHGLFSEAAKPEGACFKVGLGFCFSFVVFFQAINEILGHWQFLSKLYKIKLTLLAKRDEKEQKTKAFERV